jgi:pSer/pThr/pTyr-binding forkhead associated (FHA) protein
VLRYPLDSDRVRIGRDTSNDIWVDHVAVRPHTLLVYAKDGEHSMKVFDGAKVLLNGSPVSGMHRLYSGDRIGVADREFVYARDDTPAEVAVGLTVMVDGVVQYGMAFRRPRIVVGRREGDVVVNDPSLNDPHLIIECYSATGLYAWDLGNAIPTKIDGLRIDERVRLHDGAVLAMGRVSLRVHILSTDAHGLLLAAALPDQPKVPLGAPAPMDRSPAQRRDPGAQVSRHRQADSGPVSGGFIRPPHSPNAGSFQVPTQRPPAPPPPPDFDFEGPQHHDSNVPVTEIGSLQQLMLQERGRSNDAPIPVHPSWLVESPQSPNPRTRSQPAVSGGASEGQQLMELPIIRPGVSAAASSGLSHGSDRPAVRVKAEVMQSSAAQSELQHRQPELQHRQDEMVAVSPSPAGFHERHTNLVGSQDPVTRPAKQRSAGAPVTQMLDVQEAAAPPHSVTRARQTDQNRGQDLPPVRERRTGPTGRTDLPPPLPGKSDRSDRPVQVRHVDRSQRGYSDAEEDA